MNPRLQLQALIQQGEQLRQVEQLLDQPGARDLYEQARRAADPQQEAGRRPPASRQGGAKGRSAKAGSPEFTAKVAEFMQSPFADELMDATLGTLLVMTPQFFDPDDAAGEDAIQAAAMFTGGLGMGMAGRRLGARIGKRIHKDEIENDLLRTVGSMAGQETTLEGFGQLAKNVGNNAAQAYRTQANTMLAADAKSFPRDSFVSKYGFEPESAANVINANRAVVREVERKQREEIAAIQRERDRKIQRGESTEAEDTAMRMLGIDPSDLQGFIDSQQSVTGEHIGRMAGRFIGDEIGLLGGLGIGTMIANEMGYQSPKDIEIERLKEQLAQAS